VGVGGLATGCLHHAVQGDELADDQWAHARFLPLAAASCGPLTTSTNDRGPNRPVHTFSPDPARLGRG
jgi:hypothetical protein